jgi:hypothetical protein
MTARHTTQTKGKKRRREAERRDIQTHRQIDRQTNMTEKADKQTDRQAERQT